MKDLGTLWASPRCIEAEARANENGVMVISLLTQNKLKGGSSLFCTYLENRIVNSSSSPGLVANFEDEKIKVIFSIT